MMSLSEEICLLSSTAASCIFQGFFCPDLPIPCLHWPVSNITIMLWCILYISCYYCLDYGRPLLFLPLVLHSLLILLLCLLSSFWYALTISISDPWQFLQYPHPVLCSNLPDFLSSRIVGAGLNLFRRLHNSKRLQKFCRNYPTIIIRYTD